MLHAARSSTHFTAWLACWALLNWAPSGLALLSCKSSSFFLIVSHSHVNLFAHSSLVLFLVFFRYDDANVLIPDEEIRQDQPRWQTAVLVAGVCLVHGLVVIVVTAILAAVVPQALSGWANALGLMAALLAAIQYLPQIYTTYHLKHIGSLSIPMMCMQTPGGLLFAGSLFVRLGWAGWSSWGIFLLSAVMQGILLAMAIYYELQRTNWTHTERDGGQDGNAIASGYGAVNGHSNRQENGALAETQPLLQPGGKGSSRRDHDETHRGQ